MEGADVVQDFGADAELAHCNPKARIAGNIEVPYTLGIQVGDRKEPKRKQCYGHRIGLALDPDQNLVVKLNKLSSRSFPHRGCLSMLGLRLALIPWWVNITLII